MGPAEGLEDVNPISIQLHDFYEEVCHTGKKSRNSCLALSTYGLLSLRTALQCALRPQEELRETEVLTLLWEWLLSLAFLFALGPGWV